MIEGLGHLAHTGETSEKAMARSVLGQTAKDILSYGWHFNREWNLSLKGNSDLGSYLRVIVKRPVDVVAEDKGFVRRGKALGDTEVIVVDAVKDVDVEKIPGVCWELIRVVATRKLQDRLLPSPAPRQLSLLEENLAWAKMRQFENDGNPYVVRSGVER